MTTFTSEDREMAAKHDGIEICNDKQIAEMDVNHLVEYLNGWYSTAAPRKAATMLRQQQAEIEALKKEIASWMEQIDIEKLIIRDLEKDFYKLEIKKLAAEVVSYRTDAEKLTMRLIDLSVLPPIKKLTDKEKWKLWGECPNGLVYDRVMMFADLILRKAQEK